jgi:hypothetical protein
MQMVHQYREKNLWLENPSSQLVTVALATVFVPMVFLLLEPL